MAALKFIRSVRQWCFQNYDDERIVSLVAMATSEDINGHAEYARLADELIQVPSGPSHLNYGNVELIVETAQEVPVQAVWAGWGHASENPRLPELLHKSSIIFLGPSSNTMWLLGDKIASTLIAQTLNVPCLPWSGSGINIENIGDNISYIPLEIYNKCTLNDAQSITECGTRIGFPLMLKASNGGGGKGIRKITQNSDFERTLKQITTEVSDSQIFAVRMLESARHVEIQIIGDCAGNVVTLFSRDCTVQRRHQKIVEEAPAVICPQEIITSMEKDAIAIAKIVGYVGTGTVEYLYDIKTQSYFFLELNPRLQVEHPCTEIIANVNLPGGQLEVAIGKSLSEIKDLCVFMNDYKNNTSDLDKIQTENIPRGHVIAARITAESAEEGFSPSSGCVSQLNFRCKRHTWGYFSVNSGGKLHKYADSQFGHLFSWGYTREEARKGMVLALKELTVNGEVRTIIGFLINLLQHTQFIKNNLTTTWLDQLGRHDLFSSKPELKVIISCGASCIAFKRIKKTLEEYEAALIKGHITKCTALSEFVYIEFIYDNIKFSLSVSRSSNNSYFIFINGSIINVEYYPIGNNGLLLAFDNRSYSCFLHEDPIQFSLEIDTSRVILFKDLDPSILRAPSGGKLISFLYKDGDFIQKGSDYAEFEVMKMVMPLTVSESGKIFYLKNCGTIVETGEIIAQIELDLSNQSTRIINFNGNFQNNVKFSDSDESTPSMLIPDTKSNNHIFDTNNRLLISRKRYKKSFKNLLNILNGFCIIEPYFSIYLEDDLSIVTQFISQTSFLSSQLSHALMCVKRHLPLHIFNTISKLLNNYTVNMTSIICELPHKEILSTLEAHASVILDIQQRNLFYTNISEFLEIIYQLKNGAKAYKLSILLPFLQKYLEIEELFSEFTFEEAVNRLLIKCSSKNDNQNMSISTVVNLIFSHANLVNKNILITKIINVFSEHFRFLDTPIDSVKSLMTRLSNLSSNNHLIVALRAKQFLISSQRPSFELRHNQLESIFLSLLDGTGHESVKIVQEVIHSDGAIVDILQNFFFSPNSQIQALALELYLRRIHFSNIFHLTHHRIHDHPFVTFCVPKIINHGSLFNRSNFFNSEISPTASLSTQNSDENITTLCSGVMLCFSSLENMCDHFISIISSLKIGPNFSIVQHRNESLREEIDERLKMVTLAIKMDNFDRTMQESYASYFQTFLQKHKEILNSFSIKRVTFLISNCRGEFPLFYTYCTKTEFTEDKLFRHIDPKEGYLLELKRLCNFNLENIPCDNPNIYIYFGKIKESSNENKILDQRFFIRTIIRNVGLISVEASFEYILKASEIRLLEALDQLAIITSRINKVGTCNHIFFNFTPCIVIDPVQTIECIRLIILRNNRRLQKQKITHAEMKMVVLLEEGGEPIPLRLVTSNETGYDLKLDLYKEKFDYLTGKPVYEFLLSHDKSSLSGLPYDFPYPPLNILDIKRIQARSLGTSYVYDFPQMFQKILKSSSSLGPHQSCFNKLLEISYREMILENDKDLVFCDRDPGLNTVGMICWEMKITGSDLLKTGTFVVIANDITFSNGSVTYKEAKFFKTVGQYARLNKYPLVYLCCSSGAQIGLDKEIDQVFKVKWIDDKNLDMGVDYLYLEKDDYLNLSSQNLIRVEEIMLDNKIIYKITDIFGKSGIGVENLRGSGLMAGEMAQCYQNTFTISLVTGRAVGIGAYLVRLGRRVIQVEKSSIILTGAEALNNVLGKKIYSSHEQIGGIDIMHENGVSQLVARDDLHGIKCILKWLLYYLLSFNKQLISIPPSESIDLSIKTSGSIDSDPRKLIYGYFSDKSKFIHGFLDKNSYFEINVSWAKTLITGRGRLGGIPISYIMNDIKAIKTTVPADPADPTDLPKDRIEIGQVLSPDASFKFAQSIEDSNNENLPLFIFANFRGFSAGMKDMYDQVLKFGAMIVETLKNYRHPVFVYIIPNGELRGGSWAVLDTLINPDVIEIYSSESSSANVLEPTGTVSIKYRKPQIEKTIARLHKPVSENCINLQEIHTQNQQNDTDLIKSYKIVAETFAALHDTPRRMLNKEAIKQIIPWNESRGFFYWRLKHCLYKQKIYDRIISNCQNFDQKKFFYLLDSWYRQTNNDSSYFENDDKIIVNWFEQILLKNDELFYINYLKPLIQKSNYDLIKNLIAKDPTITFEILHNAASKLSLSEKQNLIQILNDLI